MQAGPFFYKWVSLNGDPLTSNGDIVTLNGRITTKPCATFRVIKVED